MGAGAALLGFAMPASAQTIAGSAHDVSAQGYSLGQICIVCHTPHSAINAALDKPLWDHENTTSVFTVYDSNTFDSGTGGAALNNITQPSGHSLMCLSCHDGTLGVDAFGGTTPGTDLIVGPALLDTDLTDDHPISFLYDPVLATTDGELYDPTATVSGLPGGGTIDQDMLFGGQMQCSSCHDVHDDTLSPFLRKSMTAPASGLCLTCHNK
jgi:predicted CXXCH cytochrome family protein